jgi:hypothetical protein
MTEQYSDAVELAETLGRVAVEGKRNERELRECIRQAARLIRETASSPGEHNAPWDALEAWLMLPAVQSAIALEAADEGQL